jgi:hypothetical protein
MWNSAMVLMGIKIDLSIGVVKSRGPCDSFPGEGKVGVSPAIAGTLLLEQAKSAADIGQPENLSRGPLPAPPSGRESHGPLFLLLSVYGTSVVVQIAK